jgi:hypothetical protein
VKRSSLASGSTALICPLCEVGELYPSGHGSTCCESCAGCLSGAMLETLRQITALPDALGSHACECDHPEMRLLPDKTYHCPACGSEVVPLEASGGSKIEHRSEAYQAGLEDGRFVERGSFVDNPNLAKWEAPSDRLAYYRGHRAGSEARQSRDDRNPDTREKPFG